MQSRTSIVGTLTCPLTKCIFLNPIITACGHTFEQAAVNHSNCPSCEKPLDTELRPNRAMQQSVAALFNEQPELWRKQYIEEFNCNFDELISSADNDKIAAFYQAHPGKLSWFVSDYLSILHLAARDGNLALLIKLAQIPHIDWNIQTASGNAPIHYAANLEILSFLLQAGADPDIIGSNQLTLLMTALLDADENKIRVLLSSTTIDRSINALSRDGKSALIIAVENCPSRIVSNLCRVNGINPNIQTPQGVTALDLAVAKQDPEKVLALVSIPNSHNTHSKQPGLAAQLNSYELAKITHPKIVAIFQCYHLIDACINKSFSSSFDISCLSKLTYAEIKQILQGFFGCARIEDIQRAKFMIGYIQAHEQGQLLKNEDKKITSFLNSDKINVLNNLFLFMQHSHSPTKKVLQTQLRRTSFASFKQTLPPADKHEERLKAYQWARTQGIFSDSTGWGVTRTSTVKEIDREIQFETKQLHR